MKTIQATPMTLTPIDGAALRSLRQNTGSQKTLLLSFWQSDSAVSRSQFPDLQTTYRMYAGSRRPMDMVTISTDVQAKTAAVLEFLKSQYATTRNVQASPVDVLAMQKDAGVKWSPGQPFTLVNWARRENPLPEGRPYRHL